MITMKGPHGCIKVLGDPLNLIFNIDFVVIIELQISQMGNTSMYDVQDIY